MSFFYRQLEAKNEPKRIDVPSGMKCNARNPPSYLRGVLTTRPLLAQNFQLLSIFISNHTTERGGGLTFSYAETAIDFSKAAVSLIIFKGGRALKAIIRICASMNSYFVSEFLVFLSLSTKP
jgi:hypothetical protein